MKLNVLVFFSWEVLIDQKKTKRKLNLKFSCQVSGSRGCFYFCRQYVLCQVIESTKALFPRSVIIYAKTFPVTPPRSLCPTADERAPVSSNEYLKQKTPFISPFGVTIPLTQQASIAFSCQMLYFLGAKVLSCDSKL